VAASSAAAVDLAEGQNRSLQAWIALSFGVTGHRLLSSPASEGPNAANAYIHIPVTVNHFTGFTGFIGESCKVRSVQYGGSGAGGGGHSRLAATNKKLDRAGPL
jgi:hypothetical protein